MDPLRQFRRWFDHAREVGVREPEAMALATANRDAVPSVRMVLLKQHDEEGFVFYTNYGSRKGLELEENPRAALLFHWDALGRQVRIEGEVNRVSRSETVAYAHSRSRGSQLSALSSPQSRPIADRDALERRVRETAMEYEAVEELPVPEHWGGYRLSPLLYEFWQHRSDRLHDRVQYTAEGGGWRMLRLAP